MDDRDRPASRRTLLGVTLLAVLAPIAVAVWWFADGFDEKTSEVGSARASVPDAPLEATKPPRAHANTLSADAAQSGAAPRIEVRVVVTDPYDTPLANAVVQAIAVAPSTNAPAVGSRTESDGVASLVLSDFRYRIVVRKMGFVPASLWPTRLPQDTRIKLRPGIPVRGRVVMAESGAPATGVWVRPFAGALGTEGTLDFAQTTDAEGRFEFCGIDDGSTARIFAVKTGFAWADTIVDVTPGIGDVQIALQAGADLDGTVLDADGQPIADASVFVVPRQRSTPWTQWTLRDDDRIRSPLDFIFVPVRTGADGRFMFRGVVLARPDVERLPVVVVARTPDGRVARSEPLSFTSGGGRLTRDVTFHANGRITATVTSSSPLPKNLVVRVLSESADARGVGTTLPVTGETLEFEDLPAANYAVSLRLGDWDSPDFEECRRVSLVAGENQNVEFALDGRLTLAGQVNCPDGHGVANAGVVFRTPEPEVEARADTDGEGRFSIPLLSQEPGWVFVSGATAAGRLESRTIDGVRPGGEPLVVTLRPLGRLTGRIRWASPEDTPRDAQSGDRGFQIDVKGVVAGRGSYGLIGQLSADGGFECDAPFVGVASELWFEYGAFAPTSARVPAIGPGETYDVGEIVFERGTTLALRFVDADGSPLALAPIDPLLPCMHGPVVTSESGRVRLTEVPAHPLVLSVRATPKTPLSVFVVDPSDPPATCVVRRGALVEGRVADADGRPVAGAEVSVGLMLGLYDVRPAVSSVDTGADGCFSLRVQAGRASVRASGLRDKLRSSAVDLTVADGETRTLDLVVR
jgi:hypothetical protein